MIMREYYIYMQRTKVIEYHCEWARYKWLPWEYLGYLTGTKEVYIYISKENTINNFIISLIILKMNTYTTDVTL